MSDTGMDDIERSQGHGEVYPTAGVAEDSVGARLSRNLSALRVPHADSKSFFVYLQIFVSLGAVVLSLFLVAGLPADKSNPPIVGYCVFVPVWCLLGWCVMLFLLPLLPKSEAEGVVIIVSLIGVLTGLFYLAAALALTIRIAPAGSCSDNGYLSENAIMLGSEARCRATYSLVGFLWFGMILFVS
jgi:hypothetical protein